MKPLLYLFSLLGVLLLSSCGDSTDTSSSTYSKGFLPNPNGFSFANDTRFSSDDFNESVLAGWYGLDNICYNNQLSNCALTAYGIYKKIEAIKGQSNGQCYGFSAAAAMLYYGGVRFDEKSSPAEFNPNASNAFDLTRTDVGALIASKALNQNTPKVNSLLDECMQGEMLPQYNKIKAGFSSNSRDPIAILAFFDTNGENGHAVTPYKVEENGNTAKIYVYDNNFPGNDQLAFNLDLAQGTWAYDDGQTNANVVARFPYKGKNAQNPFCSIPLSLTEDTRLASTMPANFTKIELNGDSRQVRVGTSNSLEQILGYDFETEQEVSQIANAHTSKRLDGNSPTYGIPITGDVSDLAALDTEEKFEQYLKEALVSIVGALPGKTGESNVSLSMETLGENFKSALLFNNLLIGADDAVAVSFHPRGKFLLFEKDSSTDAPPNVELFFDDLTAQEGAYHLLKFTSEIPNGVTFAAFIDAYDQISIFLMDTREDTTLPLAINQVSYKITSRFLNAQGKTYVESEPAAQSIGTGYRLNLKYETIDRMF